MAQQVKVEWRCVITTPTTLCVTTFGMNWMLKWSVNSWDTVPHKVLNKRGVYVDISSFVSTVAVKSSYYGSGSEVNILDDLTCTGSETTLLDCPRRNDQDLFTSDCDQSEVAGVKCNGMCCKDSRCRGSLQFLFLSCVH